MSRPAASRAIATREARAKPRGRRAAAPVNEPAAEAIARRTTAMFEAGGDLQQVMARRAGVLQEEAVHQLRMATNPAELMAVQAAMLMAGWQQSLQCSQDVAHAWFALGRAGAVPPRH